MSDTLGKEVTVKEHDEIFEGTAIDIDYDGSLIVRKTNSDIHRVISADVFVSRIKINQKI